MLAFNPGAPYTSSPTSVRRFRSGWAAYSIRAYPRRMPTATRRFTQGFEHAFPAQYRGHQLRYDDTFVGQEKAVNYEIPTHTLFGGGAPAGSVVHRERPTVSHHRTQHPQHRRRGVHGDRHQPREPYRDAHAGREDRYPQGHHRQGGIRCRHIQPDDDRQREIHQPDQDFAAAERGVRPAGAALCHALALPGLRVDDRWPSSP